MCAARPAPLGTRELHTPRGGRRASALLQGGSVCGLRCGRRPVAGLVALRLHRGLQLADPGEVGCWIEDALHRRVGRRISSGEAAEAPAIGHGAAHLEAVYEAVHQVPIWVAWESVYAAGDQRQIHGGGDNPHVGRHQGAETRMKRLEPQRAVAQHGEPTIPIGHDPPALARDKADCREQVGGKLNICGLQRVPHLAGRLVVAQLRGRPAHARQQHTPPGPRPALLEGQRGERGRGFGGRPDVRSQPLNALALELATHVLVQATLLRR